MSFKWKDEYSVNVAEIDKQHKKLMELGDRIVDLAMGSKDADYYDHIMEVLEELKNYTVYHFGYEEKLFEEYGYQHTEAHKFEHMFFIKKVERIEKKDIDGQQGDVIMSLLNFVADWITGHILKEDKKYSEFFNAKGVN